MMYDCMRKVSRIDMIPGAAASEQSRIYTDKYSTPQRPCSVTTVSFTEFTVVSMHSVSDNLLPALHLVAAEMNAK